jgi:NAD(P)-dependent dehydrogenase (short-subunit alcohol dehydrogenase family)
MTSEASTRLSGKVALITGGSRGIGRAIARAYAREGAKVFICARNQTEVDRVVSEICGAGGQSDGSAGDIGKLEDARRIVQAAAQHFGGIDVLVNNASLLGPRVHIASYPPEAWEEVLRVNLTGLFFVTQSVLQIMIPRRQGSIINISSGVGRMGKARWGAYAASKFGVEGFTQMVADEVREFGIRANTVNPGATRTQMRAAAYPDEDPLTLPTPDEVTEVFIYLASEQSAGVTGKSLDAHDWARGN